MSTNVLEDASEVRQVLVDARTTNAMILGALALVAYDHLITFQDEVEFMWTGGIWTTNTVYLWNRYFTLISLSYDASVMLSPFKSNAVRSRHLPLSLLTVTYFIGMRQEEAVTCTLILATVDFILVLRVWILYGKRRMLLYLLVPMIGLEIMTMALVSHYTIASVKEYWDLPFPLTGCYPRAAVPRFFAFYSVPMLVVSMAMFLMTVYKCGKTLLTHGRAQMPIYNMFLRDGVFWFVAVFVVFLPEVIIWACARKSLAEILIGPGLAVISIIGSRVLLNIKSIKLASGLPTTATTATALGPTIELDTIDYPSRLWGTVDTTEGETLTVPVP
ncbi:hypothetical protein B0H17DRAFT_1212373 [Mycena rosella]|uniref:DUF6533 domain-containing protein n=1 Tax=Mycena rosella TaxID=1033263 RepID=A0AAD7CS80_MYCRO|nr:hypothetical protein B0H17DRAFT_1212373 [Mycena rosella]